MTSDPDTPHRDPIDDEPSFDAGDPQVPFERDNFASLDSNEQTLIVESEQLLPSPPAGLDSANLFESELGSERRNLITGALAIRYDRRSGVVGGVEPALPPAVAPTPSVRSSVLSGARGQRWLIGLAACLGALALGAILQVAFASRQASAVRPVAKSAPAATLDGARRSEVLVTPPSAPAPQVAPGPQLIKPPGAALDAGAEPQNRQRRL